MSTSRLVLDMLAQSKNRHRLLGIEDSEGVTYNGVVSDFDETHFSIGVCVGPDAPLDEPIVFHILGIRAFWWIHGDKAKNFATFSQIMKYPTREDE